MVKKSAWNWIFNRADLRKFATAKVRENFDKFIAEQKGVEFTRENIEELLSMLHQNRRQIALDCVVEVFDKMTGYAKENRIHYEGWVTNDAWRVNKKVIMPCMARYDSRWGGSWDVYMNNQFKDDIDRAMCLVTGKDVNKIKTIQKVLQCARYGKETVVVDGRNQETPHPTLTEKLESEFFIIKVYQKGTAHLTFKNDSEWLEFNRSAAEAKGFPLPKDTHKKR
jgi:hypothetical protein